MLQKVEWKEKVWKKKMHNKPRDRSLMRIVKQNRFRIWVELHKVMDWVLGSRHQEPPHTDCQGIWLQLLSEASYQAKERKNWTVAPVVQSPLFRWEQFCISLGNQVLESGGRMEKAHSPSCLKSSVSSTVCDDLGCMSSAGFGPLCFLKNQRHCNPVTNTFWSTSCFLLLTSF